MIPQFHISLSAHHGKCFPKVSFLIGLPPSTHTHNPGSSESPHLCFGCNVLLASFNLEWPPPLPLPSFWGGGSLESSDQLFYGMSFILDSSGCFFMVPFTLSQCSLCFQNSWQASPHPPTLGALETSYNLLTTPANMSTILRGRQPPSLSWGSPVPFVEGGKEVGWSLLTFCESFFGG